MKNHGLDFASDVQSALEKITSRESAASVLVTGSIFIVAEVRRLLLGERSDPQIGL